MFGSSNGIQVTHYMFKRCRAFQSPGSLGQNLQQCIQRPLFPPQHAEDRFFEVPTRVREIHGAPLAYENELAGDHPR